MSIDAAAKQPGIALKPPGASTLAPAPAPAPIDPKIKKTAADFETMVIGQMLAPMFEALETNGPFGGGDGEAMFRPMLIDQYAKSMAKAGGIGIADEVAREMMRMQAGASAPAPAPNAAPAPAPAKGDDDAAGR
jgi:Rod binding domain-containing protein